ncbi:HYR domain-containing protein [Limibacter armeniacum]|uniref:HYR domain-containing protein n=1 Tax=Limibacter armeniacum TaxID=466084 RepID=UPI002FE5FBC7
MNLFAKLSLISLLPISCACEEAAKVPDIVEAETLEITCPEDILVTIASSAGDPVVTYETSAGTDNSAITKIQTAGLESGDTFPEGTTTNTFVVKDEAGNSSTCSFEVTVVRAAPSSDQPYLFGEGLTIPAGKKWVKVEALSDEFDGASFDDTKWHRNPESDGFGWYGRPPALFDPANVSVRDGNLSVEVLKYASPVTVKGKEWTHGGGIVRSKEPAGPGQYYECRMQANKTVMSSTFWIAFQSNCNNEVRKLELDIQECVGRIHSGTHSWAKNFANIYASNTWRHQRDCDPAYDVSKQSPAKTVLTEQNNARYFVYGCWWKSPTEILFFLDGKFSHSITNPPADFDIAGYITMAIETYNWNPIDEANILESGSIEDRTTRYDWVRTWKLADK